MPKPELIFCKNFLSATIKPELQTELFAELKHCLSEINFDENKQNCIKITLIAEIGTLKDFFENPNSTLENLIDKQ